MSFLRPIPIRSLSNQIRSYSNCNYNSNKPLFSPFFASLFVGFFSSGLILNRMNQDMRYQYCEFEKLKADMAEIKNKLK
jgi:hypothetical protein